MHTYVTLLSKNPSKGLVLSGKDKGTRVRFMVPLETTKILDKVYENLFQTLKARQYRKAAKPLIAPAYCLESF